MYVDCAYHAFHPSHPRRRLLHVPIRTSNFLPFTNHRVPLQVRAVVYPSSKVILSASRDGTVRQWVLTSPSPATYDDTIAVQANSFINSLTYVRPSATYADGLIVSGGKDTIIDVRQPGKSPADNAERLLVGHANNVCSLDAFPQGHTFVSGGWDAQARVWSVDKGECTAELKGHGAAVWAVLAYDDSTIITGMSLES